MNLSINIDSALAEVLFVSKQNIITPLRRKIPVFRLPTDEYGIIFIKNDRGLDKVPYEDIHLVHKTRIDTFLNTTPFKGTYPTINFPDQPKLPKQLILSEDELKKLEWDFIPNFQFVYFSMDQINHLLSLPGTVGIHFVHYTFELPLSKKLNSNLYAFSAQVEDQSMESPIPENGHPCPPEWKF